MRVYATMYYKPFAGMSSAVKKLEGGATDMNGNPLYSLEEYLMGDADYVSIARDHLAGPPASDSRFRDYGTRIVIPEIQGLMGWDYIEFRLVDTGGSFHGKKKLLRVAGVEPIDICRPEAPDLPEDGGPDDPEVLRGLAERRVSAATNSTRRGQAGGRTACPERTMPKFDQGQPSNGLRSEQRAPRSNRPPRRGLGRQAKPILEEGGVDPAGSPPQWLRSPSSRSVRLSRVSLQSRPGRARPTSGTGPPAPPRARPARGPVLAGTRIRLR